MRLVIIGGVAAGMSAASKAKRVMPECEVAVYERGSTVSYGACGLPYYVAGLNTDYTRMVIRTAEQFEAQGIAVHTGVEVTGLDPAAKTLRLRHADGTAGEDRYDRLLLAVGAAPIRPALPGADLPGVHTLKNIDDGLRLREDVLKAKQVVVAGGGYIGTEVAESLLTAGHAVRMLEAAPKVVAHFDDEVRDVLLARMREKGMQVHVEEALTQLVPGPDGRVAAVRTARGEYPADVVLMALGVRPATGFLANTGLALAPNGAVETDRQMRTNLPDVWAAGDCAMVYNRVEERNAYQPLGTVANKCGRIAGANMAGAQMAFEGALGSACIDVLGMQAGRTGMGEEAACARFGDVETVFIEAADRPSYYPGCTPLWVKLICEPGSRRIVGGQAVGEKGAVLRVDALAVAITARLTAHDLGWLDFCYAPPFSEAWDALNIAGNVMDAKRAKA